MFYVLPCVILFLCFSVLLALRLPRLWKRELILMLFVRLFDLCLFGFVGFLFLLGSGKAAVCDCGTPLTFLLPFFALCFVLVFFSHFSRCDYLAWEREYICMLFVCLFVLCVFVCFSFIFTFVPGTGCDLCFPCVILFLCFSVLLVLRLPRLGKRELIYMLFVRLFGLCLFRFVRFLFLLGSGKGCGL